MANEKINGFIGKLTSGSLLKFRSTGICGLRRKKRDIQETLDNHQHNINKIHSSKHLKPPASPDNNLWVFSFLFFFNWYLCIVFLFCAHFSPLTVLVPQAKKKVSSAVLGQAQPMYC